MLALYQYRVGAALLLQKRWKEGVGSYLQALALEESDTVVLGLLEATRQAAEQERHQLLQASKENSFFELALNCPWSGDVLINPVTTVTGTTYNQAAVKQCPELYWRDGITAQEWDVDRPHLNFSLKDISNKLFPK